MELDNVYIYIYNELIYEREKKSRKPFVITKGTPEYSCSYCLYNFRGICKEEKEKQEQEQEQEPIIKT